jgi:hypothetical protein
VRRGADLKIVGCRYITRSWPSKVSVAGMSMKLTCSGSSASYAASSLLIGRHRRDSKGCLMADSRTNDPDTTDCGLWPAGYAARWI